ncbi:unnamed protein product [Staurois parvus]|uniref:Uncharacterized protein n=1 Tax=Staurois parvus TaxID=386267 RepID=A0ABN9G6U4_9NEOB|nr:unnamed protein product [Staurois parvus]
MGFFFFLLVMAVISNFYRDCGGHFDTGGGTNLVPLTSSVTPIQGSVLKKKH